jgi:hypothetical protein
MGAICQWAFSGAATAQSKLLMLPADQSFMGECLESFAQDIAEAESAVATALPDTPDDWRDLG